jgi:glycosyltransferase involved in cell wall biosynthesis
MNRLANIRIIMTADTVGGIWTYATGLAASLAASGAEVHLVTMGPKPRPDQREMLAISPVRLIESDLALEWQDPEAADLVHARDFLASLECRIRPDIIHLNSYREANFDWQAPVVIGAHSCVNSWGMACDDSAWLSEPRWQQYTALVAAALDRADAWVAPTQAFGDVMSDLYRPRSRPITIRNGLIPSTAASGPKKCFILAAGRMWDAAKNLTLLTEAGKDLDWPVFVAGTAARSVGKLDSGIELLGELSHSELRTRMQRAAIFVSPARYEPFGLSVLEAADAGCALVLADIPTFRELWNGAALFVPANDADCLRAALSRLCTDGVARTRLQVAASRRAQRYSMLQMTEAYARLYRSLLPPRGQRRRNTLEAHA